MDQLNLAIPARAKLNLDLRVIARRADGFHDIETTIQSIDLHDLLLITRSRETLLTTSGLRVVNDERNSILKAHAALERMIKRTLPVRFHLHKRIPPGSGMGGASSDAATALRGLKTLYELDVDLAPVAEQVGADVPYFLHGGRALARGHGEKLTPLTMQPGVFTIAWPDIELSTASVYKAWDEVRGDGPNELRRAAESCDARLKDFARKLGSDWQMTGSGSAFFKAANDTPNVTPNVTPNDIPSTGAWTATAHAVGPWS